MKLKQLTAVLGFTAALGVSGSAMAGLAISPLFVNGLNTISDNNAELFVNKAGGATTVDVGDIFLGGIEIDTLNNTAIGTGTLFNELSGIFGVRVISVAPIGGGLAFFTFGAVADLHGEFLAATGVDIGATPAGTFSKLWEDATPDATRDGGSFASYIGEVSDGTLRMELTMVDGDVAATGFADLASLALIAPGAGAPISFFNAIGGGPVVASDTFADIVFTTPVGISGNAQRPVAPEDFTIRTDTTFTVGAAVPEPGTLASLGIGLLALAGVARRRRNKA